MGLPAASASNAVSGVPSQSDGKTLRSNALRAAATSLREPDEHESIAEAELTRLRFERLAQRALAHEKKLRVRLLIEHEPRGIDQIGVPFRLVQPGDRPNREVAGVDAKLTPCGGDVVGRARTAELVVRRAEIDDLHFLRLHEPRVDDEIGGALRYGDGDVGIALEQRDRRPSETTACRSGSRARAESPGCPASPRPCGRTSSRHSRADEARRSSSDR